jgi:hypothetical protein
MCKRNSVDYDSADVISDGEIEDLLSKANEFHKLVEASFDWEAILSPKPSRPVAVLNALTKTDDATSMTGGARRHDAQHRGADSI